MVTRREVAETLNVLPSGSYQQPTGGSTPGRRQPARRRSHAGKTSGLLPFLQFAAFTFNQQLQFIQQLRVMCTECFHQVGERQRQTHRSIRATAGSLRRRLRDAIPRQSGEANTGRLDPPEPGPENASCRGGPAWSSRWCRPASSCRPQPLANGGASTGPQLLQQLPLERPQLRPGTGDPKNRRDFSHRSLNLLTSLGIIANKARMVYARFVLFPCPRDTCNSLQIICNFDVIPAVTQPPHAFGNGSADLKYQPAVRDEGRPAPAESGVSITSSPVGPAKTAFRGSNFRTSSCT